MYTPTTNQVWEEKEDGSNDHSSYSKNKLKETQVSNIKENIQGTYHPLIMFGRGKKRGIMMRAAIQNTRKRVTSIIKEKRSRYTPLTNQRLAGKR